MTERRQIAYFRMGYYMFREEYEESGEGDPPLGWLRNARDFVIRWIGYPDGHLRDHLYSGGFVPPKMACRLDGGSHHDPGTGHNRAGYYQPEPGIDNLVWDRYGDRVSGWDVNSTKR